jgi:hypothetical protein
VVVAVLLEDLQERLLKDLGCERVRQNHEAVCRIRKRLHLEESDLVETACENIDGVAIRSRSLGKSLVELY